MSASRFLEEAATDALASIQRGHGGPFGAVIVRKGRILARGHNTVLKEKDPTCHAEMNAIRAAARKKKAWSLSDCVMYTTTEPCPMCFSAIHWARIKTIYYSTTIGDVARLGFNELRMSASRLALVGGSPVKLRRVKSAACVALLLAWKKLSKKSIY